MGILSRREIDRALRLGLGNAAISMYMTKGQIPVRPGRLDRDLAADDDRLWRGPGARRVSAAGEVLGIVTRTDLINLLSWRPTDGRAGRRAGTRFRATLGADGPSSAGSNGCARRPEAAQSRAMRCTSSAALCATCCSNGPTWTLTWWSRATRSLWREQLADKNGGRVRSHSPLWHRQVDPRRRRVAGLCHRAHRVLPASHGAARGRALLDQAGPAPPRLYDQHPGHPPGRRALWRAARLLRRRAGPARRA